MVFERRRDKLREAILAQLERHNVMSTRELWERLQSSCCTLNPQQSLAHPIRVAVEG
jgi:hypothetical protein